MLAPSTRSTSADELRIKLTWLTVFRTVATSLLLVMSAGRLLSGPVRELTGQDALSFGLIGAAFLVNLVQGLLLRRGAVRPSAASAQVVADVVLATCLVYVTGGVDSPFTFVYSLAVIAASILLFERGALAAAALSSAALVVLALFIQEGLLLPPQGGALPPDRLLFVLGSHVLAQFLIAVLAGYLSRQLWTTGGRLSATEANLQRLATLQREILASMPSGLITCAASGHVTFVNPAARGLLGLAEGAESGHLLEELLPGVTRLGNHARRRELEVPTRAGPRTLGLTATPLEGANGALLVVFQDLTELRRMEDALKRADALASLGTLSAQLAHEIRNPLAAMRGSAQMLAQDLQQHEGAARLTAILLREADRLSRLVEDFLRFARPPRPNVQPVALDQLVRETMEMALADPLAAGLHTQLELAPVTASVDPDQLRQVLLNLVRNAYQAVGAGGTVRVSLALQKQDVSLRVWDSAGSIPPADRIRIFEPFVTSRPGGTGLGLSTAHAIVQAHGGIIEVTSSPQEGTEFNVRIPLWPAEVARAHSGGG